MIHNNISQFGWGPFLGLNACSRLDTPVAET